MDVDYKSNWDDVRGQIENHQAFQAITLESERLRIFKVMSTLWYIFLILISVSYYIGKLNVFKAILCIW